MFTRGYALQLSHEKYTAWVKNLDFSDGVFQEKPSVGPLDQNVAGGIMKSHQLAPWKSMIQALDGDHWE